MCFSATASFVAGGALTGIGALTVSKAKTKAELPFASIPLFFGIQQIVEGVIWLSFGNPWLNAEMTFVYSMFAYVFWPIFAPLAGFLLEKDKKRRKILRLFLAAGVAEGLYLFVFVLLHPVTSYVNGNSIGYHFSHLFPLWIAAFYVVVTCGSAICSTHKIVKLFGFALLASLLVTALFFYQTLFSVWCFFAAILSSLVYLYFIQKNRSA